MIAGFRLKARVLISGALLARRVVFRVDLTAPQSQLVYHDEASPFTVTEAAREAFQEGLTVVRQAQTVVLRSTCARIACDSYISCMCGVAAPLQRVEVVFSARKCACVFVMYITAYKAT